MSQEALCGRLSKQIHFQRQEKEVQDSNSNINQNFGTIHQVKVKSNTRDMIAIVLHHATLISTSWQR